MTISAAATRSQTIPLQHQASHDRPHWYTPCDHPAIWFGKICIIQCKISPFLTWKFCYIAAIDRKPGKCDFIACKLNFTFIILPFISLHHRLIDAFVAINSCVIRVGCSSGFFVTFWVPNWTEFNGEFPSSSSSSISFSIFLKFSLSFHIILLTTLFFSFWSAAASQVLNRQERLALRSKISGEFLLSFSLE